MDEVGTWLDTERSLAAGWQLEANASTVLLIPILRFLSFIDIIFTMITILSYLKTTRTWMLASTLMLLEKNTYVFTTIIDACMEYL